MNNFDIRINGFAVPISDCSTNFGVGHLTEINMRLILPNHIYQKIINKDYTSLDIYDNLEAEPKEIISFILESLNSNDLDNAQKWVNILNDKLTEDKLKTEEFSV